MVAESTSLLEQVFVFGFLVTHYMWFKTALNTKLAVRLGGDINNEVHTHIAHLAGVEVSRSLSWRLATVLAADDKVDHKGIHDAVQTTVLLIQPVLESLSRFNCFNCIATNYLRLELVA